MYNYSCLTGYETSDSLTTQCLSDGSWSLTTPPTCNSMCYFCRYIFCFLMLTVHLYVFYVQASFCLASSLSILTHVFLFDVFVYFYVQCFFLCSEFQCSYYIFLGISCGVPPEGNNTVTVPQDNLLYEQMYNYSCLTGYETSDSLTTQCLSDGSWSLTTPPTCSSEYYI